MGCGASCAVLLLGGRAQIKGGPGLLRERQWWWAEQLWWQCLDVEQVARQVPRLWDGPGSRVLIVVATLERCAALPMPCCCSPCCCPRAAALLPPCCLLP